MSEREIGDKCVDELAEMLGVSREEAEATFGAWMKETFPEMWDEAGGSADGLDDEDYNHFTDMCVSANAPRAGGGGASGEEWVGMVIGFDRRFDMMKRKREMAQDIATADLGSAIKNGFIYNGNKVGIGRVFTSDGVWKIEHGSGTFVSTVNADTTPDWCIPLNERVKIAMLRDDNTPQRAYSKKSLWTFHGNTKDKFLSEGPRLVTLEGAWEAADHNWSLWQPITVRGKFDEEGWNDSGPTLTVSNSEATYGLDWVPEGQKRETAERLFVPDQYLTTCGDSCVNLRDLLENHLSYRRESYVDRNGNQRYDGPLVTVVGNVVDINHEGRENQYDSTGRDYWLSVSTQSLRREDPKARIGIQVSGALHNAFHGLEVLKNGEWVPFARGSRVWVVGRSDSYTNNDGDEVVKVEAHGIYAIPKKAIPARKPSKDSNDLSNLDGFSVGGDE